MSDGGLNMASSYSGVDAGGWDWGGEYRPSVSAGGGGRECVAFLAYCFDSLDVYEGYMTLPVSALIRVDREAASRGYSDGDRVSHRVVQKMSRKRLKGRLTFEAFMRIKEEG